MNSFCKYSTGLIVLLALTIVVSGCAGVQGPDVNLTELEYAHREASTLIDLTEQLEVDSQQKVEEANQLFQETFEKHKKSPRNELVEQYEKVSKLARTSINNSFQDLRDRNRSLRTEVGELQEQVGTLQTRLSEQEEKASDLGGTLAQLREERSNAREIARRRENTIRRLREEIASLPKKAENINSVTFEKLSLNIFFDEKSAQFKPAYQKKLDKRLDRLTRSDKGLIFVVGHTDDRPIRSGTEFDSNWDLSFERAQSILEYLVYVKGISKRRIVPIGLAGVSPKASNETEEGRRKNRRVEIYFRPAEGFLKP
jgi:chemotaxis protein MotB